MRSRDRGVVLTATRTVAQEASIHAVESRLYWVWFVCNSLKKFATVKSPTLQKAHVVVRLFKDPNLVKANLVKVYFHCEICAVYRKTKQEKQSESCFSVAVFVRSNIHNEELSAM